MLKQKYPKNYKSNTGVSMDADTLVAELKIFIWKIIARNNAETLTDPLFHSPNESEDIACDEINADDVIEDVKDITPTLDEIMPAPTPKKQISAKDLIADAEEPKQISMDEALQEPAMTPQQAQEQVKTSGNDTVIEKTSAQARTPASTPMSKTIVQAKLRPIVMTVKERYYALKARYYEWRMERAERRDYFKAQQLQIANKNAACYEILDYLESLQEEE